MKKLLTLTIVFALFTSLFGEALQYHRRSPFVLISLGGTAFPQNNWGTAFTHIPRRLHYLKQAGVSRPILYRFVPKLVCSFMLVSAIREPLRAARTSAG